ncbi:unnamed protein product [Adineta steineri]|uniref:TIL domain-containing protein n=1 Tax=Adineta steineri TaxID=433720 RepID=A0A814CH50_9BILA|nr:unnamed protein product [Adineta steineri]CAF0940778.1 unnamed protein product [Adineta steineri]
MKKILYNGTCGPNEQYEDCGIECQRTCADIQIPQKQCHQMCVIGCFCINGYVRQHDENSLCIQEIEC